MEFWEFRAEARALANGVAQRILGPRLYEIQRPNAITAADRQGVKGMDVHYTDTDGLLRIHHVADFRTASAPARVRFAVPRKVQPHTVIVAVPAQFGTTTVEADVDTLRAITPTWRQRLTSPWVVGPTVGAAGIAVGLMLGNDDNAQCPPTPGTRPAAPSTPVAGQSTGASQSQASLTPSPTAALPSSDATPTATTPAPVMTDPSTYNTGFIEHPVDTHAGTVDDLFVTLTDPGDTSGLSTHIDLGHDGTRLTLDVDLEHRDMTAAPPITVQSLELTLTDRRTGKRVRLEPASHIPLEPAINNASHERYDVGVGDWTVTSSIQATVDGTPATENVTFGVKLDTSGVVTLTDVSGNTGKPDDASGRVVNLLT